MLGRIQESSMGGGARMARKTSTPRTPAAQTVRLLIHYISSVADAYLELSKACNKTN